MVALCYRMARWYSARKPVHSKRCRAIRPRQCRRVSGAVAKDAVVVPPPIAPRAAWPVFHIEAVHQLLRVHHIILSLRLWRGLFVRRQFGLLSHSKIDFPMNSSVSSAISAKSLVVFLRAFCAAPPDNARRAALVAFDRVPSRAQCGNGAGPNGVVTAGRYHSQPLTFFAVGLPYSITFPFLRGAEFYESTKES